MIVTSQEDIAKIDALWGDPDAWSAQGLQWTHLAAVQRMNNRHLTGREDQTDIEWFFERLSQQGRLPLDRVLVLACGSTGVLEAGLARPDWIREVVAIDISPRAVEHAADLARERGLNSIRYLVGDMNNLDIGGLFDVVFGVSAIHHCAALEDLYATVQRILKPDGWFYIQDYIGPTRFQWPDTQVLQVNRLLQTLPDRLVRNARGQIRRGFNRVPAADIAAFDPSEAVRSAEIEPLLGDYFSIELRRGFGGGLLHLALAEIAQNFDADLSRDPSGPEHLRLLIDISDHLRENGQIADDFALLLARPLTAESQCPI